MNIRWIFNKTQIFVVQNWGDPELHEPNVNLLHMIIIWYTTEKTKSFIKDFFSKCDQIRSKLRIWSHLLKKSLIGSFIFCAVIVFNSSKLKVQSCKLYDNKYMIALTQITNNEIFAFIVVLVFKLLSHKLLFINRKYNRNR